MLKNDLLIRALKGEEVDRPPVWMMRQAGRYLEEFRKLKVKYDFFTRVQTPELASEITIQPVNILDCDAAILFSDILVIPQALGLDVQMIESKGPILPRTIQTLADIEALSVDSAKENLAYVYEAIRITKEKLNQRVPLIGFAGGPFTILCYIVEGKTSKNFEIAKAFCFRNKEIAHRLLHIITVATIDYLKGQIRSGVDVIQIFDSWSGLLSPDDFKAFAEPYLIQISNACASQVPVILFPKGSHYALKDLSSSSASALGIDWTISPRTAREITNNRVTLQGNYDPCKLYQSTTTIKNDVQKMIREFGKKKLIVNLGHGILPDIPRENALAFISAVKEYRETQ